MRMQPSIFEAAGAITRARNLLFAAGAGMGVDSGLPDFRGNEGFWKAYPPFARLGLSFMELANPRWFRDDPHLAWGFYGHRLKLYRTTAPHDGFPILRRWQEGKPAHVFTSNVDGQFQKAGLENVYEVHGSIHHLQCTVPCEQTVWSAEGLQLEIDPDTMRAVGELPRCPHCGALARPAILMFGDSQWVESRAMGQGENLMAFLHHRRNSLLTIVELGAGTSVPTVRRFSEQCQRQGAKLVRVNLRDSGGPAGTISLPMAAREALEQIDAALRA